MTRSHSPRSGRKPTVVDLVQWHLARDPAFAELLSRDLVRLRPSARWLIDLYGWDATEEAVTSALRRHRDDENRAPLWEARADLQETQLDIISGLALVTIPGVPEARDGALEARIGTPKARTLTVLQGRRVTRLLIEEHAVETVREALDEWGIEDIDAPAHAIRLVFPSSRFQEALMIQILSVLAHHEIDVLEAMSCSPDYLVVVNSTDSAEAFRVVSNLCRGPPSPLKDVDESDPNRQEDRDLGRPGGRPAFP